MHKTLAVVLAATLGIAGASPAIAGKNKKKTVKEEFQAAGLPWPAAQADPGPDACGVENVTYTTHTFTTPGKGTLDVRVNQYQGDWDLYVTDGDGNELGSSTGFVDVTEERVVVPVGARVEIIIYACNFLGGPTAHGELKYTYKA